MIAGSVKETDETLVGQGFRLCVMYYRIAALAILYDKK